MTRSTSTVVAAIAATLIAQGWVFAGTVDVTTVSAGKKVITKVDTASLEAETTTVLRKAGTVWVEDAVATEDAREKLADERAAGDEAQESVINDCDGNGIDDAEDIASGADDSDSDGRLDQCEFAYGDLNLNGIVNQQDVSILMGWWGISSPQYGDLDGDGSCGPKDLGVLLARWGSVL
ncbi:MAG: hypothetical protein EBR10_10105 [Planctomycetes bacterium]|nr:hypothetical protein [Planctomycetota bacterium]